MDSERDYRGGGRVPLPDWEDSAAGQPAPGSARENGVRRLRRMSGWSAAALIVGTGAATVAFAHGFTPAAQAAGPAAAGTSAGTAGASTATAHGGPAVAHSVATTSASGVTTVTTSRTVGGKTVVTHVQRAPAYQDN